MCHVPVESVPGPVEGSRASEPRLIALQPVIKGDLAVGMIGIRHQKDERLWIHDSRSVDSVCDLLRGRSSGDWHVESGHDGAIVASSVVVGVIVVILPIRGRKDARWG
jgi:hypothetical protein